MKKFLFETSFESGAAAQPANLAPEAAGAAEEALPSAPAYTEEDLNQARSESFVAGREDAQRELTAAAEQRTAAALEEIARRVTELLSKQQEFCGEVHRQNLSAAMTVLRKLFPRLARRDGLGEIQQVVSECLGRLRDEPRVVVRMAAGQLDPVRAAVQDLSSRAGFEGRVVFLEEDGLGPSDIKIEWADGGAERNCKTLWQEIDRIITQVTAGNRPPPAEQRLPQNEASGPDPAATEQSRDSLESLHPNRKAEVA